MRGRVVAVPKGLTLREGQEVLLVPLPQGREPVAPSGPVEDEDVAFVRACRGRLAHQLDAEDARRPS